MDIDYPVALEVEYNGYMDIIICQDPEDLYFNLSEAKYDMNFKDARLFGLVEIEFPNLDEYVEMYEDKDEEDYPERDDVFLAEDFWVSH